MNTYRLTKGAEKDLRKIWRDLASQSPVGADQLLDRIYHSIRFLAANPISGSAWPGSSRNLRCHPVPGTRYLIFFYPTPYGVRISQVIYGGRNPSVYFPS
jgi:plasmid stabilization system protein ParE